MTSFSYWQVNKRVLRAKRFMRMKATWARILMKGVEFDRQEIYGPNKTVEAKIQVTNKIGGGQ